MKDIDFTDFYNVFLYGATIRAASFRMVGLNGGNEKMAATRLFALHINKGKTVAQCLADRTDYSENAAKTENGKYISSYACDAKTCNEEFLLSKRQYEYITGRTQAHDVIAYQIRQSFKPGEITPEEANKVGYETAMRFTKGKACLYCGDTHRSGAYSQPHHFQFHVLGLHQKVPGLLSVRTCPGKA